MSSALFTDEQNARDVFLLASVSLAVGVADGAFYFKAPVACTLVSVNAFAASGTDGTDKYAVAVRRGSTAILLTEALDDSPAATAGVEATVAESSQSLNVDKGEILNVLFDESGTEANVIKPYIQVWAKRR